MGSKAIGWDQLPFKDIFTSKSFRFLVGPEKREFMVHKEIIARLSPALDALLNGNMREAAEGVVEWDDLDEDTFTRFAQYAYTGNYDAPEPEILLDLIVPAVKEEPGSPIQKRQPSTEPISDSSSDDESQQSMSIEDDNSDGDSSDDHDHENTDSNSDSNDSESDDGSDGSDDSSRDGGLTPQRFPTPLFAPLREWPGLPENYSVELFMAQAEDNCPEGECEMAKEETQSALPINKKRKLDSYLDPWEDTHARDCPMQTKKYKLMQKFRDRWKTIADDDSAFRPQSNTGLHEAYTRVFMTHATLYILADKYRIQALGRMAQSRLLRTLHPFTVYDERVPDIVALVRFCYENTVPHDPLRGALALYAACVVEDVGDHPEFRNLLVEVGDFAADLVLGMMKRVD